VGRDGCRPRVRRHGDRNFRRAPDLVGRDDDLEADGFLNRGLVDPLVDSDGVVDLLVHPHGVVRHPVELAVHLVGRAHFDLERPVMSTIAASPMPEAVETFSCFGGSCTVLVQGHGPAGSAAQAAARIKRRLLDWHLQFSRFEPDSELSCLNRDPREWVPVSAMMMRFAAAAIQAAELTGGLVDPTLVREVEAAGYAHDFVSIPTRAADTRPPVPERRAAAPHPSARWREVHVDPRRGAITRPVGVQLDSGGIAKGLFGDVLASVLAWHESYAIEAAGERSDRWAARGRTCHCWRWLS
jgi:ApbE family